MSAHLETFLISASYLGIFLMLLAETGLLVGFFLPGDSLLVTAGILAAGGKLSLVGVSLAAAAGAILGDSLGYLIGHKAGEKLFHREKSKLFNPANVERARQYYDRYGAKTLILARFVPVLRTFAPSVAGVGQMPYRRFLRYNVIGGLLWAVGLPALAYSLGQAVPHLERYLYEVIAVVVVISLIPAAYEWWKSRRRD